jgi:hypothetical protein
MSLLTSAVRGVASAVAPSLVTGVQSIKDWYNEKKLLQEIDDLHKQYLAEDKPEEFNPENVTFERSKIAKAVNRNGKYDLIANDLVETIDDYLLKRSKRSIFSNGRKGDPLQRFLYEWRRWAIGQLAGYDDSVESEMKVYARLTYLEEIIRQQLFQNGRYTRENSKFSTFEKMRAILGKFSSFKEIRENQKSVNITLGESLNSAAVFYASSLRFCYLAADSNAYENNFQPEHFYRFDQDKKFLSKLEKKIYARLYKNYKGSILKSILDLSFLNFHNSSKVETPATESLFYTSPDKFVSSAVPNIRSLSIASFPWSTPENESEHLIAFQNLGREVLNISELTSALELAIKLTAEAGNVWAKGPGEMALLKMMSDYRNGIMDLEKHFKEYLDMHSLAMRAHFHEKSNKDKNNWLANFQKMKNQFANMQAASAIILEKFELTRKKLEALPVNNLENANVSLELHNRNAKRNGKPLISSLNTIGPVSTQVVFDAKVADVRRKIEALEIALFETDIFTMIDKPVFESYNVKTCSHVSPFSPEWNENNSYQNWIDGFTSRNSSFFREYHAVIADINKTLQPNNFATLDKQKEDIETQRKVLYKVFREMIAKITDEQPRWKTKHFLGIPLPVRLGPPFNRKATAFANLLKDELRDQLKKSIDVANETIKFISSITIPEVVSDSDAERNDPNMEPQIVERIHVDIPGFLQSMADKKSIIAEYEESVKDTSPLAEAAQEANQQTVVFVEQVKTKNADEPFEKSYHNIYNKFLNWANDKSSILIFFPHEISVKKYFEYGIAFKERANPEIFKSHLKPMRLVINNINIILDSLSSEQINKYKPAVVQLTLFSALLDLITITDPALYNRKLAEFNSMSCTLNVSNIQNLSIYRTSNTAEVASPLVEKQQLRFS